MPRVVQVPSSETEEVNLYHTDSSGNEDTFNRNFNQTRNYIQESMTTYMRFPINYSLYNVTYLESETDPYCLRCVIGGRVKKFKKDARTWLHKSSDRKRKMEEEKACQRYGKNISNATANKHQKLVSDVQQIISCGGAYRSSACNTDVNDVKSELSSLGDSEADLTYSEESSPSLASESREQYQKSVRFNHNIQARYRSNAISSDSDDSLNAVGKTTSSRNVVFQEELKFMEEDEDKTYNANESRNNIMPGPLPLQFTRIAPAIISETASLQETLLDCGFNNKSPLFNVTQKSKHQPSGGFKCRSRRGTKWKKIGGNENTKTYNLRSAKKFDSNSKEENMGKSLPSRWHGETGHLVDVKPAAASLDLAHPRQIIGTDEKPCCSRIAENNPEYNVVPKLFFLASLVLYKYMKSNLNKCT